MIRNFILLIVVGSLIVIQSCKPKKTIEEKLPSAAGLNEAASVERLPNDAIGDIVKKAITVSGGWENYQKKQTFSFHKVIQHYDSTGTMLREVKQLHQYRLQPRFQARLTWNMDGHDYVIINNGEEAWMLIDGQRSAEDKDINEAWNTSFGSHYVMFMPFKLADPGVIFKNEEIDTLSHGQIVNSVNVNYEPGAGSSAGFHNWHYYFNIDNGRPVGNFLDYGSGKSYTKYITWQEVAGIRLGEKRSVYGVSIDNEIGYLKTVYINESMEFDLEMADELFSIAGVQ
ncbi:MAG: hypothetical protein P8N26_02490 [Cyclobacteriaceae bacterium]|nr:hypothetical protein [Cyclobacteriaceae bacterium]